MRLEEGREGERGEEQRKHGMGREGQGRGLWAKALLLVALHE